MGFDIIMINKIITYFNITSESEAIDYLIKDENGMWNHPFIPKEKFKEQIKKLEEFYKGVIKNKVEEYENVLKDIDKMIFFIVLQLINRYYLIGLCGGDRHPARCFLEDKSCYKCECKIVG